ncbi:glutamyl-tRNA synthetase [Stella humosa]|uniref:Glutamate--tRNA ligase n=1 Tax=Stella humosa TaxID=94 RepID=A0A3N1M7I1_9PROT|nr:glutamate--tRNA ligase [Stella humosa]ROP99650.1 glutamyl-tRNA synthetase [Stella humosa]BBK31125.1 glutamate--tRNA ligase 1 [Stella humosa]
MTVSVRFAPSPTGFLHVGNARTALVNWLFARRHGGRFLLRLDDTDLERSEARFADGIFEDLAWLGLDHDRFERQSDRLAAYRAAFDRLHAAGRVYACYETPDELALKRKVQLARHQPPVYDRAGLRLSAAQHAAFAAEGRRPHWRFRLDDGSVGWDDIVHGPLAFDGAKLGDPVILRADGQPIYTFASVVDDLEMGISHVIRGDDHISNTPVHIQIYQALGGDPAGLAFAHLALLAGGQGEKLSKRQGSLSLRSLRDEGVEAMAVAALLARLGTADPVEPATDLARIVDGFDLARFGRSPPHFELPELWQVNAKVLHLLPFAAVSDRLAAVAPGADADFWEAIRPNLERLADAAGWWQVCRGPLAPVIDEPDFAAAVAALLPPEPWDGESWRAWTLAIQAATGRKGKALFQPLRRALTARDHGPEMRNLLPLIGRERVLRRLAGETA